MKMTSLKFSARPSRAVSSRRQLSVRFYSIDLLNRCKSDKYKLVTPERQGRGPNAIYIPNVGESRG